ncbi:SEL1-like repeat protein [Pseudomonas sp. CGJS7]|uniref:SEL1-like repeat protein n=1 Tax=Pseudomonas sp. CGJS7 TaxID=3109348 RepID=UPI00300B3EB9
MAQLMLGRLYHFGLGVQRDLEKARHWYGKAMAQGSIYAFIFVSFLERQDGRWFKGVGLRIRSIFLAAAVYSKDKADIRLRRS